MSPKPQKKEKSQNSQWSRAGYLVKGIFKEQLQELHNWELGVGLDPPQVDADKEPQEVCELLHIAGDKDKSREGLDISSHGHQRSRI